MKNTYLGLLILSILSLASCRQQTVTLKNVAADGNIKIEVNANRKGSLNPWKVGIAVTAYAIKKGSLNFELEAADLNEQTVHFDWTDNNHCTVSFNQRDGAPRKFQLLADSNQVILAEVNP